jgi:hypothetical protein
MNWDNIRQQAAKLIKLGPVIEASWSGKTIRGVRTSLKRQDVLSDAGLIDKYQFSLLCAPSEFAAGRPIPRQSKMVIGGTTYRVLAIEDDSAEATVKIHLGGEYE